MKTRTWILIFSAMALLCVALTFVFLSGKAQNTALVYSGGELAAQIDLSKDSEYCIENGECWNILTVKEGKISVISSSCTSKDCIRCGARNTGAPIVCLPNQMVIEFTDSAELDALLQ